jgi:hypothetical protein
MLGIKEIIENKYYQRMIIRFSEALFGDKGSFDSPFVLDHFNVVLEQRAWTDATGWEFAIHESHFGPPNKERLLKKVEELKGLFSIKELKEEITVIETDHLGREYHRAKVRIIESVNSIGD